MRVPPDLYCRKQWLCWRSAELEGKRRKLPINPLTGALASSTDPLTWSTYHRACAAFRERALDGIGFVFTHTDTLCGVDLDDCVVNGRLTSHAQNTIASLNSYTEWSPSRRGVHILVHARLREGLRRSGKVEMYDSGRYFTFTGKHLSNTPFTIEQRQQEICRLQGSLGGESPARPISSQLDDSSTPSNRNIGAKFQRLWSGDTCDYDGDHSRADAALCLMLAVRTGGCVHRIDALFRSSGLFREKWDRPTGDSTYGARTIQCALRLLKNISS